MSKKAESRLDKIIQSAYDIFPILENGCVYRKKRRCGDNFFDYSSGHIDEHATDILLLKSQEIIEKLIQECQNLVDEVGILKRKNDKS